MAGRQLGWGLALGSIVAAACSDLAGGPTTEVYELALVNGAPLPAETVSFYTILGGSLELVSDGTCRRTVRVRTRAGPATTDPVEAEISRGCTWTRDGSTISFTWAGDEGDAPSPGAGPAGSATIRGDSVTLAVDSGIRCVTVPCPSSWTERYVRTGEA